MLFCYRQRQECQLVLSLWHSSYQTVQAFLKAQNKTFLREVAEEAHKKYVHEAFLTSTINTIIAQL